MISVCIATYNGEHVIRTQLDSILPQLSTEDEIVISDDCSSDKTLEVIASYNDSRLRVVKGPAVGSPIPNFENALNEARGEYIFLSDQDDCWCPNKVKEMMKALKENDCVMSDCYVTNERLDIINPSFFALKKVKYGRWTNLLVSNNYLGGCLAFRRNVLTKSLPFPAHTPMHDIWIGNIAAFGFRMKFIEKPLSYFRRHEGTASTTCAKSSNSFFKKLTIRYHVISALTFRLLSIR